MSNKKVVIIAHQARAVYTCWSVLIQHMQKAGYEVVCCVSKQEHSSHIQSLKDLNVRVINYSLERKGINPLHDIKSLLQLYNILRHERPQKIFTFAIKPVIYSNIAANLAGIKDVYSCITGLGFSFEPANTIFKKLLHHTVIILYKFALRQCKGIIFQNIADKEIFLQKKILPPASNILISNGTGVDTKHFYLQKNFPTNITFLLMARLLIAKGIEDFAKAAQILKLKYPCINFQLLGPLEQGPGSLSQKHILNWQQQGLIEYLGETIDVRPYIAAASVVVLPSWREGLSCSLMEAMSMGRPIVASQVPGCKELIEEGVNGFLVPPRDAKALANALEKFIINKELLAPMGAHSRRMAIEHFDAHSVARQILHYMDII